MSTKWQRIAGSTVVLLASLSAVGSAQAPIGEKVRQYMGAAAKLNRFSGSILIAKNGKVIASGGYQYADREWNAPNGLTTEFRIGSLTKQFTAMAILILQERNSIKVTNPVCDYVPNCPASWRAITIHELLSHTSGIPDYTEFPDYEKAQGLPVTPKELMARIEQQPLKFQPGEKFEYSNSGYVVLGSIIETVSGKSYQDFLQQNIFAPLGMKHTGYDVNASVIPGRASGYTRNSDKVENAPYIDMSVPFSAGGLYSTVSDLLLWDRALYTGRLVSRKSLDAMFTPYKDSVGYGWAIDSLFDRKMIHHNGSVNGFVSNIARFPDDGVLIVVLSNLEQSPVDVITKDLAAITFGKPYELPKARHVVQLPAEQYEAMAGRYEISKDLVLTITREGNHLFGQLSGQAERFALQSESPTRLFSEEPPVEIVFTEREGKIVSLKLNGEYNAAKMP